MIQIIVNDECSTRIDKSEKVYLSKQLNYKLQSSNDPKSHVTSALARKKFVVKQIS